MNISQIQSLQTTAAPLGVGTAFGSCAGVFHAAAGRIGIVMVPPLGFEALTIARGWRLLAERFAAAGYPVLRFDLPGTGDSLDPPRPGLRLWEDSLRQAVDHLAALAGVDRFVLAGHGLGATLALRCAAEIRALQAVVALAPVVSGRAHLRELAALAALSGSGDDGVLPGGFVLHPDLAADLRGLALADAPLPVPAIVVARPEREAERRLAERIGGTCLDYVGHQAFLTDPTGAVPPVETFEAIVRELHARCPAGVPLAAAVSAGPGAELESDRFTERAIRFGADDRLFGILTRPRIAARDTAVLIVNSGRDPHVGWARIAVDQARAFAAAGYASLRFDLSGIGESPEDRTDAGRELLYGETHRNDVLRAIDTLVSAGYSRIVLTGRCSGAYAALHAAPRSDAVTAVVPINPLRIVWDPSETVEEALRQDIRPLGTLSRRLTDPAVIRRLVTGGIPLRPLLHRAARLVLQRYPQFSFGAGRRLRAETLSRLGSLNRRGTRVAFVFAEGDGGLDRLEAVFGPKCRGMRRLSRFSVMLIEKADHNLNALAARSRVTEAILDVLAEIQ